MSLRADRLGDLDRDDPPGFSHPVTHVYNPLVYARAPHQAYLARYGQSPRETLLLGMNPGPWGMVQTGVPFGEVHAVRDWLGITGRVSQPARPHPKRPVLGFACTRREVSGARLWGWARDRFHSPQRFFRHYFVANYCPLAFFAADGRNITPDRLARLDRERLLAACDAELRNLVLRLGARRVIGVGAFAEARARAALAQLDVDVARIPHPSPASPIANRGWVQAVEHELSRLTPA